jgi:hypothetical protein
MDKREIERLLLDGRIEEFNLVREHAPGWSPDLSGLDLSDGELYYRVGCFTDEQYEVQERDLTADRYHHLRLNLRNANLCGAKLRLTHKKKDGDGIQGTYSVNGVVWIRKSLDFAYTVVNLLPDFEGAIYDTETEFILPVIELVHYPDLGVRLATAIDKDRLIRARQSCVFISYAWADAEVVSAIDQWLRERGTDTRMDRRDFFAGSRIRDEIARVMGECNVILVFYTKRAEGKPWVEFERELVEDLVMEARKANREPPRLIYVCLDKTPLPDATQRNRIAVMASGRKFPEVCQEIHDQILQTPRTMSPTDLSKFEDYTFE